MLSSLSWFRACLISQCWALRDKSRNSVNKCQGFHFNALCLKRCCNRVTVLFYWTQSRVWPWIKGRIFDIFMVHGMKSSHMTIMSPHKNTVGFRLKIWRVCHFAVSKVSNTTPKTEHPLNSGHHSLIAIASFLRSKVTRFSRNGRPWSSRMYCRCTATATNKPNYLSHRTCQTYEAEWENRNRLFKND